MMDGELRVSAAGEAAGQAGISGPLDLLMLESVSLVPVAMQRFGAPPVGVRVFDCRLAKRWLL